MEILITISLLVLVITFLIWSKFINWFFGANDKPNQEDSETISFEINDKSNSRVLEVSDDDVEVKSSYDNDMNVLTLILKDTVNDRETQPFSIKLGEFEDNQTEIIKTANDGNIEVIQTKKDDGGFELDINIKDTTKLPFEGE